MRRVYFGPYQHGFLRGTSAALDIAADVTKQEIVDLEEIFYATAFQGGVDRFVLSSESSGETHLGSFMSARTNFIDEKIVTRNRIAVQDSFGRFLPADWEHDSSYNDVLHTAHFLEELLNSLSARSALLSVSGIPDISETQLNMPAELATPVQTLLGAIGDLQAVGPIPRRSLERDTLSRFIEIMESDLFVSYSHSQAALDDAAQSPVAVTTEIKKQARSLYVRHARILAIQRTGISVLDLTARLIDALFGPLPGALSDVATKLAYEFLDSRRRIVIYDASQTIKEVFLANVGRMIDRHIRSGEWKT